VSGTTSRGGTVPGGSRLRSGIGEPRRLVRGEAEEETSSRVALELSAMGHEVQDRPELVVHVAGVRVVERATSR
jgi:hypothetical protein